MTTNPGEPGNAQPPLSANHAQNPILNSAFKEPHHHWPLDDNFRAMNNTPAVAGRRPSGAEAPVPHPIGRNGKRGGTSRPAPRGRENTTPFRQINALREAVKPWRAKGYPGVPAQVGPLLRHWGSRDGTATPYFCQLEAVETAAWLRWIATSGGTVTPAAQAAVDAWRHANHAWNTPAEGLTIERVCLKMATGTGKTWVMAMLALIEVAAEPDRTETDILILTPNLTIRNRLACLGTESDHGASADRDHERHIYRSLLPPTLRRLASRLRVSVRNRHAFGLMNNRTGVEKPDEAPSKRERAVIGELDAEAVNETPTAMLARVLPQHGRRRVKVLNDEGHHCYHRAEGRENVWFEVLATLMRENRLDAPVADLSATPWWPSGENSSDHRPEIFPWTITDTPLIEAVEAGLCKVPQLPVDDDTARTSPLYRDTYNQLGKKPLAAPDDDGTGTPTPLPPQLRQLLDQVHTDQEPFRADYRTHDGGRGRVPVTIMITRDTADALVLYRHVAGYRTDEGMWEPGAWPEWSNVDPETRMPRPALSNAPDDTHHVRTWIVHSKLDDAKTPDDDGPAGSADVKMTHKAQEAFAPRVDRESALEYAARVMRVRDTVGVRDRPGEHVHCVIAVQMLNEGWDAATVTHVVGYRAFDSPMLCEQVAGRALRRVHRPHPDGEHPGVELARVTGVPFAFMSGKSDGGTERPESWTVRRLEDRKQLRIALPQVTGYRIRLRPGRIVLSDDSRPYDWSKKLTDSPSWTVAAGVAGPEWLIEFPGSRYQSALYHLAALVMKRLSVDDENADAPHPAVFGDVLTAVRRFIERTAAGTPDGPVRVDPAKLAREPHNVLIAERVTELLRHADSGERRIEAVWDTENDGHIDTGVITEFGTTLKKTNRWPPEDGRTTLKCELDYSANHVRLERTVAEVLDKSPAVNRWVRNYRLGWMVPYIDSTTGVERRYEPDFAAEVRTGTGARLLMIEPKGPADQQAGDKENAVRSWWLPAVNEAIERRGAGAPRWEYHVIAPDEVDRLRRLVGA